jgi:hypothetical protein
MTRHLAKLFTIIVLVEACGGSQPMYVRVAAGPSAQPSQSEAMVVLIRPSGYSAAARAFVVDTAGTLLAEVPAQGRVGVRLPAGKQQLVIFGEQRPPLAMFDGETKHSEGHALVVDLLPGKTYMVEVGVGPGMWMASFDLFAFSPRMSRWDRRNEWLSSTVNYDFDAKAGRSYFKPELVQEKVAEAGALWAKLPDDEKAQHTLRPDDGA